MGEGKDQKGKLLLIIGALLVVIALTADAIGIGVKPGFGWKQGLVLIAGLGIALMGKKCCVCTLKESSNAQEKKDPPPTSNQV